MEKTVQYKIIIWILLSINLLCSFFIGLYLITFNLIGIFLIAIIIPIQLISIVFIINFLDKDSITSLLKKKIFIWILLSLNLLFAFMIGATIPFMESKISTRYNMAYVMVPLLIILNYVIIDRLHYFIKHKDDRDSALESKSIKIENDEKKSGQPVIEFEGRKFIFSIRSILLLAIGAPVLSFLIYLFFDNQANYWLHEIVVKHTVFFLNTFFNMGIEANYNPIGKYYWSFNVPGRSDIYFETFCTGVQAICVFAGIIICTPHSKDKKTNEDIIWRKTKSLFISSVLFYVVNIIRMVIQIYLYSIGYAWEDIHYSISAASSFVAAIIVLLMHKWIPEFIISIIYTGTWISKKIKEKKNINEAEVN